MIVHDSDSGTHLDATTATSAREFVLSALVVAIVFWVTLLVASHQAYTENRYGAAMACEKAGGGHETQIIDYERCYVSLGDGHWREIRKLR